MKLDTIFLRSKLARRIFTMFVACALIPFVVMSVVAYRQVSNQITMQSEENLRQGLKAFSLSIYERLLLLESEMKLLVASLPQSAAVIERIRIGDFDDRLTSRFVSMGILTKEHRHVHLFGKHYCPLPLDPVQKKHVLSNKTLLVLKPSEEMFPKIIMARALDPDDPEAGFVSGVINPVFLWGTDTGNALPPLTEFCVLDGKNELLFSTFPGKITFSHDILKKFHSFTSGQFELEHQDRQYLAFYRSLFLEPRFLIPDWTIVVGQLKTDVLSPMEHFEKLFPLVVLLAIWVVLLLSLYAIRRSLVPLELLKRAASKIANRDFHYQVDIESNDEFQEVGEAFNEMASRLDKQFKDLKAIAAIDRAILSSLNTEEIIETVITHLRDNFSCDVALIALIDPEEEDTGTIYYCTSCSVGDPVEGIPVHFSERDLMVLNEVSDHLLIESRQEYPPFLLQFLEKEVQVISILPILVQGKLSAALVLGYSDQTRMDEEELGRLRQTANQMAVALSNARLLDELETLNWNTLEALARAVDAKSSWTAGHSYRVTRMALELGSALGLSHKEMEILHRGPCFTT